jgi:hypothetical protein
MDFSYSKQGLLDALEARRAWAVALDKKLIAKHAADEKKTLVDFKNKLRAALKWTYEDYKRNTTYYTNPFRDLRVLSCPTSVVARLDNALREVNRDGRKRYRVTDKAGMRTIHYLLTYDENAKPDVCK